MWIKIPVFPRRNFIFQIIFMDNEKGKKYQNADTFNENKKVEVPYWQPALLMFTRMSGWIIGPVVLAIFLGKWLDRRYDTEPWLFLLTVGFAFIISMTGLVKDAFKEVDKLTKEDSNNKNKKNNG